MAVERIRGRVPSPAALAPFTHGGSDGPNSGREVTFASGFDVLIFVPSSVMGAGAIDAGRKEYAMVTVKQAAAALAASGAAVCAGIARRRQLRWGATDAEVAVDLPGDNLLPRADLSSTRAITIAAPLVDVWPWIAQMGQGRGGLYSYDFLENLAGCDIHSADRIVDEWQDVAVGDPFRLHPDVALQVRVVDPGHALVVQGGVPMGDTAPPY
ncbi:MAG: hypothetical protein M3P52_08180, partial [Actinomycetota bacterium]|nr:hypothetical protein [Actinomycetota bacterium]